MKIQGKCSNQIISHKYFFSPDCLFKTFLINQQLRAEDFSNYVRYRSTYHRLHIFQCDSLSQHHLVKWTNEKCCKNKDKTDDTREQC